MFGDVSEFARDTGWLYGTLLGFAKYAVVVFAVLLVADWRVARDRSPHTMAAALWAGAGPLVAVAPTSRSSTAFRRRARTPTHHQILVLATPSADYSFPSDHAVMAGAVAAGPAYENSGLVVVDELGRPLRPEVFTGTFRRRARDAGLPDIRLHDARHTAASLMLELGHPVHVVAAWLGHDPVMTQRVYAHVHTDALRALGSAFDQALSGEQ
jgi:hypothetical protein